MWCPLQYPNMDDLEQILSQVQAEASAICSNDANSSHQKKKRAKLGKFVAFVAEREGLDASEVEHGLKTNPSRFSANADLFLQQYMAEQLKKGNKARGTLCHRLHSALRGVGLTINPRISSAIVAMLKVEKAEALAEKERTKADQTVSYEDLKVHLLEMIRWLAADSNKPFKVASLELLVQEAPSSKSYVREAIDHVNKTMDPSVLRKTRFQMRAMLAFMVVTGMRGVAFWRMSAADIQEITVGNANKEGLLVHYKTRKTGLAGGEKTMITRVVHNVDPTVDASICYFQFLRLLGNNVPDHPFRLKMKSQDYWWKRCSAFLQVAAFAVGATSGFTKKKLHAVRGFCTTNLLEKGATKEERDGLLGWKSMKTDVEASHYLVDHIRAVTNKAAFIAAGRLARGEGDDTTKVPAPHFWDYLDQMPGPTIVDRVCQLASAAGYGKGKKIKVDGDVINTIARGHTQKRPRQNEKTLEMALAEERAKNARREGASKTKVEVVADLEAIVETHLMPHACSDDFPHRCKLVVKEHMAAVLDASCQVGVKKGLGLGLELSSGFGRNLMAILRFAVVPDINPANRSRGGNWLNWAKTNTRFFKSKHMITETDWWSIRHLICT